ncbi:MAG: transcription termination/antitermination NusG family protein [Planctomycetota bacterium]|jgi:transcription antitermination factor NusG
MQWFVLRVASNKEERVREALARKMQVEGVEGEADSCRETACV